MPYIETQKDFRKDILNIQDSQVEEIEEYNDKPATKKQTIDLKAKTSTQFVHELGDSRREERLQQASTRKMSRAGGYEQNQSAADMKSNKVMYTDESGPRSPETETY